MTNIYRDILKRAWYFLWQHPWLWLFGVFVSITAGIGEYTAVLSSLNRLIRELNIVVALKRVIYTQELDYLVSGFRHLLAQPVTLTVIMATAVLAIVLFFIWLITISQIGLVEAAGRLGRGESVSFGSSLQSGISNFWSVLWLNILTKLLIYLLLVVSILPFLISFLVRPEDGWGFSWLILISFFIFVPLSLILVFVVRYAIAYVVLEKDPWWVALERGINLFFRNWLISLEMSIILAVIYLALGIVIYAFLPDNLMMLVAVMAIKPTFSLFLKFLPSLVLMLFIGIGYGVFQYLAWVLLFDRLNQGTALAKLVRLTKEVPEQLEQWFVGKEKGKIKSTR